PIIASSLEDTCPRKVYYFAQTGKVLMKRLWATRNNTIAEREADYQHRLAGVKVEGEVELFG
ncbi:MAG: chemoreceptor glutamine deamidase CheD, partial [Betaproteobacteria bacterium]|nr:chemoreceptor glutamine deamidase CheD [Betaproteobacteria bacterium]